MKRWVLTAVILVVPAIMASVAVAQRSGRPGGPPGPGAQPQPPDRFHPLIRLFDSDGDGALSQNEIDRAAEKLKELDASKDGRLTADELPGPMPFGPGRPEFPRGGFRGRGPGGGGPRGPGATSADFDNPLLPKNDEEKKILATLKEMQQGPGFANVSTADGRLLRQLAEAAGAKRIVEIGTSTGESAMWFALALRSTGGKLFTHEIDAERAGTARKNFKKAGVDSLIAVIEGDAHETVDQHKAPIDILFLDADKQGYIDYLDKLLPLVRPGGLVIAHNMSPRQADPRYLEAITKNPNLETSFLLMEGAGVGVTLKKR